MEEQELRDNGHWVAASCLATFGDEGFAARMDGRALVVSGVGGKVEAGKVSVSGFVSPLRLTNLPTVIQNR